MFRHRTIVCASLPVLIASIVCVFNLSYFRSETHCQAASPDGRWVATVTKRVKRFPEPIEVRLQVSKGWGDHTMWENLLIDEIDVWSDARPDSYAIQWISPLEFVVADQQSLPRFRGTFADPIWSVRLLTAEQR